MSSNLDVLVLNHDYNEFLSDLYTDKSLANSPYSKQLSERHKSLFGISDFYPRNLEKIDLKSHNIYVNNSHMQLAWAREHLDRSNSNKKDGGSNSNNIIDHIREAIKGTPLKQLKPVVESYLGYKYTRPTWFYEILRSQIEYYNPDIILNQSLTTVSTEFLAEIKSLIDILVGQIQAPLPTQVDLSVYDGLVSALPNLIQRFDDASIPSLELPLAFDDSVLDRVEFSDDLSSDVIFVGSLSQNHNSRIEWLSKVCDEYPIDVYAPSLEYIPDESPIHRCYRGTVWGRNMYKALNQSKIVLNNHIDMAGPFANNLRLFEATGVGSCLLTDWKSNLPRLFKPGRDVLTYKSPEECVSVIQKYVNSSERTKIAKAGQKRTLREHTYDQRMDILSSFFKKLR